MPHQCLKCGSVFADGSPEILRGCPKCEGTRFFYTEKPLLDEERNRLKERANKDIKQLIQDMLTSDSLPMDMEEGFLEKSEWVNLGVKSEVEPEKAEVNGRLDVKKNMIKSIEDLVYPEKAGLKKHRTVSKSKAIKEVKKAMVKETSKEPKKEKPKKEERVEVITIDDEGVYDIDVEKLLEDSPIIVQKDGSYLVHLPSVFEKVRRKESVA